MERVDPAAITAAILAAPGWCRVGITAPNERLRETAARELAQSITAHLTGDPVHHRDQLALPL